MADVRIRMIIEGRVQGVWFRDSARREALALGVTGWVRNRPDGSVEVLAEGAEDSVRRLSAWCRRGPSAARVTRVREDEDAWVGKFDTFRITV